MLCLQSNVALCFLSVFRTQSRKKRRLCDLSKSSVLWSIGAYSVGVTTRICNFGRSHVVITLLNAPRLLQTLSRSRAASLKWRLLDFINVVQCPESSESFQFYSLRVDGIVATLPPCLFLPIISHVPSQIRLRDCSHNYQNKLCNTTTMKLSIWNGFSRWRSISDVRRPSRFLLHACQCDPKITIEIRSFLSDLYSPGYLKIAWTTYMSFLLMVNVIDLSQSTLPMHF